MRVRRPMQKGLAEKDEAAVISHQHPGLMKNTMQPFEPDTLNPQGCAGNGACMVVERCSDPHHPRSANAIPMGGDPSLLFEQSQSHPDDVTAGIVDSVNRRIVL